MSSTEILAVQIFFCHWFCAWFVVGECLWMALAFANVPIYSQTINKINEFKMVKKIYIFTTPAELGYESMQKKTKSF